MEALWRKKTPLVHVVRLQGAIGVGTPFKPPLTLERLAETLEPASGQRKCLRTASDGEERFVLGTPSARIRVRAATMATSSTSAIAFSPGANDSHLKRNFCSRRVICL